MRKVIVALILAAALLAAVMAMETGGAGVDCVPRSPTPSARSGSTRYDLPDGGKLHVHSGGQQVVANGSHGFIVAEQNGSSAQVYGHSKDAPVNGYIKANSNGRTEMCLDAT